MSFIGDSWTFVSPLSRPTVVVVEFFAENYDRTESVTADEISTAKTLTINQRFDDT